MRKEVVFVLCCFCLIPFVVADAITGDTIATGEVTSSELGMIISIVGPPALIILSPLNETYLIPNISLRYNAGSNDAIWYNLDVGGNISLTPGTRLLVDEGTHFLYLYANNSYGTSSENVVFSMNESRLKIHYENYRGSTKGDSTDFEEFGYESLQSLEDIVLENSDYGKIYFEEVINVTDDFDNSDNDVDLDNYISISSNSISLNSAMLPNFDKPAILSLYNLSFSNPRILVDGEVCPSVLCKIINYAEGTLEFNVSHFSTYSAEETPEDEVVQVSRGGSGGGRVVVVDEVFSVDKDYVGIRIKRGRIITEKIVIENNENRKLKVDIWAKELGGIIALDNFSFILEPLESREISVDFIARETSVLGIYIEKMVLFSEGFKKEILFSVVVESEVELFDISVDIPEAYLEVHAGEDFLLEFKFFNLGEVGRIDVKIKYFIKNSDGETIISEEEFVAVETSLNFVKTFHLPSDMPLGGYVIYVQVSYADQVIGSSAWFYVVEKDSTEIASRLADEEKLREILAIIVIILVIVVIFKKNRRGRDRT